MSDKRCWVKWVDRDGNQRRGLFIKMDHAREDVDGVACGLVYDWKRTAGIEVYDE